MSNSSIPAVPIMMNSEIRSEIMPGAEIILAAGNLATRANVSIIARTAYRGSEDGGNLIGLSPPILFLR